MVAVAYKRFQIQGFDSETFGILENWSLRRDCRLREVLATGGSTVADPSEIYRQTMTTFVLWLPSNSLNKLNTFPKNYSAVIDWYTWILRLFFLK